MYANKCILIIKEQPTQLKTKQYNLSSSALRRQLRDSRAERPGLILRNVA